MRITIGIMVACLLLATAGARAQQTTERKPRRAAHAPQPRGNNEPTLRTWSEHDAGAEDGAQELQSSPRYEGPHMRIEAPLYNFGDVQRKGGDLRHDFQVVNDGIAPLVITRVVTSCTCLKAAFPKRPLHAGATAVIRITYEPHKNEPGAFHKVIQVFSNSVEGREVLTVQGNSMDPGKM